MRIALPPEAARARDEARRLVESELTPHDRAIEETGQIPAPAVECLRRAGFFGLNTPREHGGQGLDMLATCAAIAELARAHIAYYYIAGVNVHLASKGIELDGNDAQRRRWLPELASGRMIGAFALTEAEAGSDAAGVRTTAVPDGDHWVLNGRKRYITNAPVADLFTVFATSAPGQGSRGMTAFVVERGRRGSASVRSTAWRAVHGSLHAEVILTDCRVPASHVIGTPGDGFGTAMRCLNAGRVIWSAYSVGAAEHLLDLAIAHVTTRRQFGRPLADNRGSSGSSRTWPPTSSGAAGGPRRRRALRRRSGAACRDRRHGQADRGRDGLSRGRSHAPALRRGGVLDGAADRADLARPARDPHPGRHVGDSQDDRRAPRAGRAARPSD